MGREAGTFESISFPPFSSITSRSDVDVRWIHHLPDPAHDYVHNHIDIFTVKYSYLDEIVLIIQNLGQVTLL